MPPECTTGTGVLHRLGGSSRDTSVSPARLGLGLRGLHVESDATDSIPVQEKIFFATSQFAKRQFTWMKKFTPNITIELDKNNEKKIRQNAYSILEYKS